MGAALGQIDPEPTVMVHYPAAWTAPETVADNTSLLIQTEGVCVVYFTVEASFLTDDTDDQAAAVHDELHFVIGGYGADGTGGRVRVNGVETDGTDITFTPGETALIDVEEGWVWVSDAPPPNWGENSGVETELEPPVSLGALAQSTDVTTVTPDEWVSWSIITLLRGRRTMIGSYGTEFIARVKPWTVKDPLVREAAYGLSAVDAAQVAMEYQNGAIARAEHRVGGGKMSESVAWQDPSGEKTVGPADQAFVDYVVCRVGRVQQGTVDCPGDHAACLP
jgi:hypothetical protein